MDRTQALIVRAQQGDKAASEQLVLENAGLGILPMGRKKISIL